MTVLLDCGIDIPGNENSLDPQLGKTTDIFSDNSSKVPQQCPGMLDCPWPLAEPAETNANYCQFCWFILQCRHLWSLKSGTIAIAVTQVTTEPSAANNCHSLHPLKTWSDWQHGYESHFFPSPQTQTINFSHWKESAFSFLQKFVLLPKSIKNCYQICVCTILNK